jgi:putative FmdB family regulatory protein
VPTYQYVCTDCDTPLEAVQSFTDDALTVCPSCGGRLRKVFSAVGVVFKGSGFYRTDSRSTSAAAVDSKDSGKSAAKEGSSSGSGEKSSSSDTSGSGDKASTPSKDGSSSKSNGSGSSTAPAPKSGGSSSAA